MKKNTFVLIIVLLALIAGVFIALRHRNSWDGKSVGVCPDVAKICPDGSSVGATGPDCEFICPEATYVWEFKTISEGNESLGLAPKTEVFLKTGGRIYNAGVHEGNCSHINTGWTPLPEEIDGVICYHAGFGSEVGIFKENSEIVVKKGVIEEGTAEEEGLRGDFEVLFKL